MDKIKQRLLIGVGFAIVGYIVFKKYGAKWFAPKLVEPSVQTNGDQLNFLNANGGSDFIAQQYDANTNSTWISYQGSSVVGYWQKGKIKEGTPIHGLT
jgi:hypothetical protein